jgi:hypothetical protein
MKSKHTPGSHATHFSTNGRSKLPWGSYESAWASCHWCPPESAPGALGDSFLQTQTIPDGDSHAGNWPRREGWGGWLRALPAAPWVERIRCAGEYEPQLIRWLNHGSQPTDGPEGRKIRLIFSFNNLWFEILSFCDKRCSSNVCSTNKKLAFNFFLFINFFPLFLRLYTYLFVSFQIFTV